MREKTILCSFIILYFIVNLCTDANCERHAPGCSSLDLFEAKTSKQTRKPLSIFHTYFHYDKTTRSLTRQTHVNIWFHHLVASARSQQGSYVHLGNVAQCHRGSVSDSVYQLQRACLRHTLISVCAPSLITSPLSRPTKPASEQSLRFAFPLLITMVSHSAMTQNI